MAAAIAAAPATVDAPLTLIAASIGGGVTAVTSSISTSLSSSSCTSSRGIFFVRPPCKNPLERDPDLLRLEPWDEGTGELTVLSAFCILWEEWKRVNELLEGDRHCVCADEDLFLGSFGTQRKLV